MNKNPDINWKFVLIGTAISIASGFLLKNNIKELEDKGIGRPSTFSNIIATLIERDYVTKTNKEPKKTIPLEEYYISMDNKNITKKTNNLNKFGITETICLIGFINASKGFFIFTIIYNSFFFFNNNSINNFEHSAPKF